MKPLWPAPTASPWFIQLHNKYIPWFRFSPDPLYDIWLQDGGTEKCSNDTGIQKEKKKKSLAEWKAGGSGESRENQN